MSRAALILATPAVRERAIRWIASAPERTRVEFYGPQRTSDQNAKMWAMLTDVAQQREHAGRKYSADMWKVIFLHALGQEMQFVPALDGKTFLPIGISSSKLSKAEMSDMIELMMAWGAEKGIVWSDPLLAAEARAA
jgi:hypothetical protein